MPIAYGGVISMIITGGTVVSSLLSDRMTKRFGAAAVAFFSVCTMALALFGFSVSGSFWMLCLWAIPYGLGAGAHRRVSLLEIFAFLCIADGVDLRRIEPGHAGECAG